MLLTKGASLLRVGRLNAAVSGGCDQLEDVDVLIVDGRISSIARRGETSAPSNAQIISLEDQTLSPGIIDAHMHFFGVPSHRLEKLPTETESYRALRGAGEARKMLIAGITAAKDLGSTVGPDIRRAINEGHIPGPRLQTAGQYVIASDGTWEYDAFQIPATELALRWSRERDSVADGPDALREMVRRRARQGASAIKLGLSKGRVDDEYHAWGDDPLKQTRAMTLDEACAAVDEAHAHGMKVSAHCIGETAVTLALDAGVDVIEHGYGISEETRARLAESQVLVGSTISQLYSHRAAYDEYHYSPSQRALFDRHTRQMRADFEKSLTAGVRYVLGTDLIGFPTHPQDSAAREYQYAVEWGMTERQALIAGMLHGAEALGLEDEIGSLEVGKIADLIATAKDPLEDITTLQQPSFVMQGGAIIRKGDSLYI